MTIDELIKYYEEEIKRKEIMLSINCTDEIDDEVIFDLKAFEIALATLKAHKQGLRMCEVKWYPYGMMWECNIPKVQTDLDKILSNL
jgi:hypothetical protein